MFELILIVVPFLIYVGVVEYFDRQERKEIKELMGILEEGTPVLEKALEKVSEKQTPLDMNDKGG